MRYFFIITFYFIFSLLFGLTNQSKAADIIANVNGENIFNYDTEVRSKILKLLNTNVNENELNFKKNITTQLIEEKLITLEAKNYNLSVSEEDIENQLHYIESLNKWSKDSIYTKGKKLGLRASDIKDYIYQQVLSQEFVQGIAASGSQVTKEELDKEYYNILGLNGKTQYLISEIFVSSLNKTKEEAEKEINKIYNNLKQGNNFNIMVSSYSDNIYSKNNKGIVGWVYETEISDETKKLLNSITKNQFTSPIFLNNGYYIFKLLDKRPILYIDTNDINQVNQLKIALRQKLMNDKANIIITNYIENLKTKAIINYY